MADNEQALLKNPKLRGQAKPKASEKPVDKAQTPSQAKKQAKKEDGDGMTSRLARVDNEGPAPAIT